MDKIRIRMSYTGEKMDGQGVGAATIEQVNLIKTMCQDDFIVKDKKGAYDLLHIHTVDPKSFIGAKFSKKPVVAHVHFLPETMRDSLSLSKRWLTFFSNYFLKLYRNADYLVVVNPIFIKELVKYGIKEEHIKYIPNFVSEETFFKQTLKVKEATKEKYGIKQDAFVVLGVGQIQHRKGVLDFIEVAKSMPDTTFVWAGGFTFGKISDGYKELKHATQSLPENVKFIGVVPRIEMNHIYNMADLLFMPSYNELFPMAILEACSSGVPILLRDLELYEDILFKGYKTSNDNQGFIEQIRKLKEDKAYYEQSLEHARKIKSHYSRIHVKEQWEKFYKDIYNEYAVNHKKRLKRKKLTQK